MVFHVSHSARTANFKDRTCNPLPYRAVHIATLQLAPLWGESNAITGNRVIAVCAATNLQYSNLERRKQQTVLYRPDDGKRRQLPVSHSYFASGSVPDRTFTHSPWVSASFHYTKTKLMYVPLTKKRGEEPRFFMIYRSLTAFLFNLTVEVIYELFSSFASVGA